MVYAIDIYYIQITFTEQHLEVIKQNRQKIKLANKREDVI